jgi:hypothetical protein
MSTSTQDLLLQKCMKELRELFERSYKSSCADSFYSRLPFHKFFWNRIKGLFTMTNYPSNLDFSKSVLFFEMFFEPIVGNSSRYDPFFTLSSLKERIFLLHDITDKYCNSTTHYDALFQVFSEKLHNKTFHRTNNEWKEFMLKAMILIRMKQRKIYDDISEKLYIMDMPEMHKLYSIIVFNYHKVGFKRQFVLFHGFIKDFTEASDMKQPNTSHIYQKHLISRGKVCLSDIKNIFFRFHEPHANSIFEKVGMRLRDSREYSRKVSALIVLGKMIKRILPLAQYSNKLVEASIHIDYKNYYIVEDLLPQ